MRRLLLALLLAPLAAFAAYPEKPIALREKGYGVWQG